MNVNQQSTKRNLRGKAKAKTKATISFAQSESTTHLDHPSSSYRLDHGPRQLSHKRIGPGSPLDLGRFATARGTRVSKREGSLRGFSVGALGDILRGRAFVFRGATAQRGLDRRVHVARMERDAITVRCWPSVASTKQKTSFVDMLQHFDPLLVKRTMLHRRMPGGRPGFSEDRARDRRPRAKISGDARSCSGERRSTNSDRRVHAAAMEHDGGSSLAFRCFDHRKPRWWNMHHRSNPPLVKE